MKNILYIILISLFSLTVISCSSSDESASTTTDTTAPVIAEVTAVLLRLPTQPPHIHSVPTKQEPSLTVEVAPVPPHRPHQAITQSPSAHSVTAPTITAQSW